MSAKGTTGRRLIFADVIVFQFKLIHLVQHNIDLLVWVRVVGFLIMLSAKPLEDSYSTRAVVNGPDRILRLGLCQLGEYSNQTEYVCSSKTTDSK